MSSQIARKLDSLAIVNSSAVTVVYTEGCAKTATGSISACKHDSMSVNLSVTSIISYSTHNTGKICFCYTLEKFSLVVSSSIGLNFAFWDQSLIMLCCPTTLPMM